MLSLTLVIVYCYYYYYIYIFEDHLLMFIVLVQIRWLPWALWALEADDARDQDFAWGWSRQRVVLVALGEVTIYFSERCWRQVGGGVEEFVVPHPPPRVKESEGTGNLGDEGIDASVFLD